MRRCYQAALIKNPKLGGKISVGFRLSPEGRVYDAKLSQVSVPDVALQDCVVGVFELIAFEPPPDGDMTVDYPIDFSNDEKSLNENERPSRSGKGGWGPARSGSRALA